MPDKVRVVFAGVGNMGQCAHLRNYATLPECEVIALAEPREKTARRVAERHHIPRVYPDLKEMIEKESFDAIVASQPFWRHGVLLPELLRAGKPIFIEKPLASSLPAAERVLQSLKGSGTWIMVGYHKRSDPACMFAKAEIDTWKASGELGNLKYVRITMPVGDWIAGGFFDCVNEKDRLEGLETDPAPPDMDKENFEKYWKFVNYYIHQVNLLRYFLGEPYHVTFADPSGVIFAGQSDSGIPCVIEMNPYRTTLKWDESILVGFEKGYIKLELPAPLAIHRAGSVEILRDPGDGATPMESRPHLPWVHAMRQQAVNFLAAVRGERPPLCDAFEAYEDLRVAREYLRLWKGV